MKIIIHHVQLSNMTIIIHVCKTIIFTEESQTGTLSSEVDLFVMRVDELAKLAASMKSLDASLIPELEVIAVQLLYI